MAKKRFDIITELYAEAVKEVAATPENWMAFLNSACRNYRLPFDEQLLVHVQRPDATAVLQMEDWNRKFGRWVKRDSKGIVVIDKNAKTMRLKHYFDISDTQEGRYRRLVRPVPLWEVGEKYRQDVQETLANAFGVSGESLDFAGTILEAAENAADDNIADYLKDILSYRTGSFLEELDEYSVEVQAKSLLSSSIAYMVMVRCGIDTETYLDADDFRNITDFNTQELVNLFGTATSDVAEMALGEISDTILKLQKEEKRRNRTFAGENAGRYNESEKDKNNTSERGFDDERDSLQQTGRLPSAGHHRTGRTGSTPWEVRLTAPELSERAALRDILKPADAREAEPAPEGNAGGGAGQDGTDRVADGTVAGGDGGTESERPDVVAFDDEQHPAGGGGNRDERTGLRITSKEPEPQTEGGLSAEGEPEAQEPEPQADGGLPTEDKPAEVLEVYDRSSEDSSFPFFGEDEDIKSLLLSTPHLKADKGEIRAFFETHEDKKEQTEYIKGIFNNEYTEITLEDGRRVGYKTYQNVLHMWEGSYLSRTSQSYFDWGKIAGYFEGMRLLGELKDKMNPLPTVEGQLSLMEDLAEEKTSAFSFSQEIIDTVIKTSADLKPGKYGIYVYFLKNRTNQQKADYLKNAYGFVGAYPVITGTGIDMLASSEGMQIIKGETEILLKWGKVAKRIDELIAAGRYMTEKEMEYLPEYEKSVLTAEIYHFYTNQPEEVARPYPFGSEYRAGVKAIRPQIDIPERVEEILTVMAEVLNNTADYDNRYPFMQKVYRDLTDYQDGKFSLISPIPAETETPSLPEPEPPIPPEGKKAEPDSLAKRLNELYKETDLRAYEANVEQGESEQETIAQIEKQLSNPDEVGAILDYLISVQQATEPDVEAYQELAGLIEEVQGLPAMNQPYDLQPETVVYIGMEKYEILTMTDSMVVLHDLTYPLFTKDMPRGEFDRKLRENPANDHLKIKRPLPEPPAEKKNTESLPAGDGQGTASPKTEKEEIPEESLTVAQKNYRAVMELAPEVLRGETESKSFEAGQSFMPLTVESIGENRIAISHYYTQNGDSLADPDMEFVFDHEAKTLNARTFQQDNLNRFEQVVTDGVVDEALESELNDFASQWFQNIREQGYLPTREEKQLTESDVPIGTEKEGNEQADLAPAWEKKKPAGRIRGFDLHPEIPKEQRSQYRITNDELGHGTPKEKFRANIAAIQLLKKCEEEDRYATPEEQEILSKYVGWGGLSDAFDETKSAWGYEYLELKTVLTQEEYAAARQSTLTAFYTPPVVIRAMYQALENMGLKSGNILEPSCAVGNFIGMKPESLSDCKIYGVEIDSISGRIAGQLYQKSTVAVQGYEEAELPDSFFDVAIGNVPFGQFKLSDRRYDKNNFLVHDYFFAKTLDKVRPGGVIAFITSSGTMDKKNPAIRKYIAQRADLLGAIRLPNDTFKKNAGTEVTSDILFLQKRDRMVETEPDWLYLDVDENGITQNRYFVEHPEMVLGEMVMESTKYGMDSACRPYEDASLETLLAGAVENIQAEIAEQETDELVEEEDNSIPADPSVANFSFTVYDGKIYYRENSRMKPVELSVTAANRVKGMAAIRDCVRELIAYQTEGYADTVIEEQQRKLNQLYDAFQKKYGILNARANSMVFSDDNSYPLLCSLEIVAEDGIHARKADMFHKRTIKPHQAVTKVDTASEALSLSLSEKARVDMDYMCSLTGKNAEEIERELSGVIFRLPNVAGGEPEFVSEDEYLSGNVREKLKEAKLAALASEAYQSNVEALEKVQPKDLTASEISVRLGATWIPISDVSEFMFQLLDTPNYNRWNIKIHFSKFTGEWNIEGKSNDKGNPKANNAYGTHRANAYKIIEDTLNLRDTRVYDYIPTEDGKKKAVLNKEETAIAQGKQDLIKQAFQDWIWQNPERRQRLTAYYNENFNAIRPREYDGSHLNFYGMNPEIKLRQHQKNGAARIIYGGNSLLAYVVGAGKTYTMVAAAMECKRLGLCNKSMIVVPNHIIEQFAAEWLQLYPAANLLVATKKDFETKNRKKFCARIATSDIDAVIIGHSQFEKVPLSTERQQRMLEEQMDEIIDGIAEAKRNGGSRFTIKQMEKSKKSLQTKLSKLNDQSRKDDVVFFEELGVDRLFVDEADGYKNLYLYTKMRNVGGIAQTEAQKSSDMFMKCRYLDGITGGKGVIFATGTPVSNSMVELYTMQRYLQYNTLVRNHLQHFDAWASTFGETVSAIELAPEGSGYRMKTRFARFYNLPELMMMFREVADIQTADMLNLPVPEAEYKVVAVKPSEIQKDMVQTLGERAERVRNGMVNPMQDNMLLITNDGRKLALDQRLTNEMLPDEPESKVNACVNEVYKFWEEGKEQKLTQLLFCDLSTPKNDGTFSVYNDVRDKLIAKGIPPQEIEFIHDANTEVRKKELFSKVRRGAVRILMGSTFKMGAGTNVQNLIIASHDLDCPWRPRDLEQRGGRTIRQGNQNKKVFIVRYVTEGTFDAYMYQMIENKQKFISQIMTSKSPARTIEDIDEVALSYAEIKALATGNPYIKEKMDLDIQVSKLQLLKQSFLSQRYEMEDKVTKYYPMEIKRQSQWIVEYQQDIEQVKAHTPPDRDTFPPMQINGMTYGEKKEAGQAIIAACKAMTSPDPVPLGAYRGLAMELSYSTFSKDFVITLQGKRAYHVTLGTDIHGNITRLDNEIEKFGDNLSRCEEHLETLKAQLENAKIEAVKEFPKEQELAEKTARLGELNALLDMDKKENIVLDVEPEEEETEPEKGSKDRER